MLRTLILYNTNAKKILTMFLKYNIQWSSCFFILNEFNYFYEYLWNFSEYFYNYKFFAFELFFKVQGYVNVRLITGKLFGNLTAKTYSKFVNFYLINKKILNVRRFWKNTRIKKSINSFQMKKEVFWLFTDFFCYVVDSFSSYYYATSMFLISLVRSIFFFILRIHIAKYWYSDQNWLLVGNMYVLHVNVMNDASPSEFSYILFLPSGIFNKYSLSI